MKNNRPLNAEAIRSIKDELISRLVWGFFFNFGFLTILSVVVLSSTPLLVISILALISSFVTTSVWVLLKRKSFLSLLTKQQSNDKTVAESRSTT